MSLRAFLTKIISTINYWCWRTLLTIILCSVYHWSWRAFQTNVVGCIDYCTNGTLLTVISSDVCYKSLRAQFTLGSCSIDDCSRSAVITHVTVSCVYAYFGGSTWHCHGALIDIHTINIIWNTWLARTDKWWCWKIPSQAACPIWTIIQTSRTNIYVGKLWYIW